MILTKIDKQLLRFADDQYPIPWIALNPPKIVTPEERPLVTLARLAAAFPKRSKEEITSSIKKLIAYECIKEMYLAAPGDFEQLEISPGFDFRLPIANVKHGVRGYQVTQFGKDTRDGFARSRAWKVLGRIGGKIAEDWLPMLIMLIVWELIKALTGIDVRKLVGRG